MLGIRSMILYRDSFPSSRNALDRVMVTSRKQPRRARQPAPEPALTEAALQLCADRLRSRQAPAPGATRPSRLVAGARGRGAHRRVRAAGDRGGSGSPPSCARLPRRVARPSAPARGRPEGGSRPAARDARDAPERSGRRRPGRVGPEGGEPRCRRRRDRASALDAGCGRRSLLIGTGWSRIPLA